MNVRVRLFRRRSRPAPVPWRPSPGFWLARGRGQRLGRQPHLGVALREDLLLLVRHHDSNRRHRLAGGMIVIHRDHLTVEEREVTSEQVGLCVARRLRALNHIAYVRFMSVFRKFARCRRESSVSGWSAPSFC